MLVFYFYGKDNLLDYQCTMIVRPAFVSVNNYMTQTKVRNIY